MALTFANKVTVGRILIVPFFIATVLYYSPDRDYLRWVALGFFVTAVISDLVDGYIARTHHQKTKAGAILDPLADKLLLISAFVCLYKVGTAFPFRIPLWLVVALISRDVILILGTSIIQIVHANLHIHPTIWGKATAFFQGICIMSVLLQVHFFETLWYITVVLTLISGVDYIRLGSKILNNGIAS